MGLTAAEIFASKRTPEMVRVDVPEWAPEGMDPEASFIYVRNMSGLDRGRFDEARVKKPEQIMPLLVVYTACDATGKRLFDDNQLDRVSQEPSKILFRIFNVAMELNRLGAEDVDEAEGESAPDQT